MFGAEFSELISPEFYDGTLTTSQYLKLLKDVKFYFLDDFSGSDIRNAWFPHYGTHRVSSVQQYVSEISQEKNIRHCD